MKKKNIHISNYFKDIENISNLIDKDKIQSLASSIYQTKKKGGRIFFLGVGGSAGNCSHAVNDFRKYVMLKVTAPQITCLN